MSRALLLAALLLAPLPALAQQPAARTELLYVEALPTQTVAAARALRAYAARSRAEPGAASVRLLRELGRPERLVVYEVWQDDAALKAHLAAANRQGLPGQLAALTQAPIDDRLGGVLPESASLPAAGLHVLIHIDVAPPAADRAAGWFTAEAQDARKAKGFLGFEVSQQPDHTNHFTIAQAWKTPQAYAAYTAGAGPRAVRAQIAGVKGALYDERLYRAD